MDLQLDPVERKLADAVAAGLTRTGDRRPELARVGVPAISVPARWRGMDLGLGADAIVNHELGRGMEPLPGYRESMLALDALRDVPDLPPAVEEQLLGVARGESAVAPAGLTDAPATTNVADRLYGTSGPLPDAPWEVALVRTATPARGHFASVTSWAVAVLDPATCDREPVRTSGMPGVVLRFNGAAATTVSLPPGAMARATAAARIRQAAFLAGLSASALEAAAAHVAHRRQFDQPLLEFQSVRMRLAAAAAELDGWILLLREAAWIYDQTGHAGQQAAQALAACAEHALDTTTLAVHLFGARGMVAGSPAGTAYLLAGAESVRLGSPSALWTEAGRARLAVAS